MEDKEFSIDEMFAECAEGMKNESSSGKLAEYDSVVDPWEQFEDKESVCLSELLELAKSNTIEPGFSTRIADNIYRYNSKANIVESSDHRKLVVLPDAEVVIDLCDTCFEFKLKYNSMDDCIKGILHNIKREGFQFLSFDEAVAVNSVLINQKKFPVEYLNQGKEFAQGTSLFGQLFWSVLMDQICHGSHNWAPCITYSDALGKLMSSLLSYDVICYESLAYIKEESGYCIETKVPLENSHVGTGIDEHRRVAIFSCFDPHDPQAEGLSTESALKYLGMYRFDKERSEKENYIAFKLCHDDKLYI
jgi:hypothetical protein